MDKTMRCATVYALHALVYICTLGHVNLYLIKSYIKAYRERYIHQTSKQCHSDFHYEIRILNRRARTQKGGRERIESGKYWRKRKYCRVGGKNEHLLITFLLKDYPIPATNFYEKTFFALHFLQSKFFFHFLSHISLISREMN